MHLYIQSVFIKNYLYNHLVQISNHKITEDALNTVEGLRYLLNLLGFVIYARPVHFSTFLAAVG